MGGVGIVLGLATYGYKIMRVLGVKMTKLTNSRGFVVELSAAIVVVVGSRYGCVPCPCVASFLALFPFLTCLLPVRWRGHSTVGTFPCFLVLCCCPDCSSLLLAVPALPRYGTCHDGGGTWHSVALGGDYKKECSCCKLPACSLLAPQ